MLDYAMDPDLDIGAVEQQADELRNEVPPAWPDPRQGWKSLGRVHGDVLSGVDPEVASEFARLLGDTLDRNN